MSDGFLLSVLRMTTPLWFAALAGLLSERSGVVQLGLEGMMLVGALAAAIMGLFLHNPWLGFLSGASAGCLLAGVMGIFILVRRADSIITGTALNILAAGICPFVTKIIFNTTGSTPAIPLEDHFQWAPTWIAVVFFLVIGICYYQFRAGLWLQFAGESPKALEVAGIRVNKIRWFSLLACGCLAGMGGATLSLALASSFSPNMTAGRGFMALAALIFGRWKPWPVFAACLLFGGLDALQISLQSRDIGVPIQFIQILPYLATIIALAGFFGQSRPPKALGPVD